MLLLANRGRSIELYNRTTNNIKIEVVIKRISEAFLATAFEGGRHENRVNKINC